MYFVHVHVEGMCMLGVGWGWVGWGGRWLIHVPVISFLTSLLHGYEPETRQGSLIRKRALLLLAKI